MIVAFRRRFPNCQAACSAAEDSDFFGRSFDGVVAWGLLFLLPAETQRVLIAKVERTLKPGGKFLFTAPNQACTWTDSMTGQPSISLGSDEYRRILAGQGLRIDEERQDEGENHYYFASKR